METAEPLAARPRARLRLVIVGATGRMGRSLVRLAGEDPQIELVAALGRGQALLPAFAQAEAVIEFALPAASIETAQTAAREGKALVIGTTGHGAAERAAILTAAQSIAIVASPNFSVGVNLLFYLTRLAAETLDDSYDREIVEMHHRHKLDAPSGTARRLGEILAEVAGGTYADLMRFGGSEPPGARERGTIGLHALRGGDIVGDHTVRFAAAGEMLELSHRATDRDTFSRGALRAARWVSTQKPGLYTMAEVLGLPSSDKKP